MTAMQQDSRMTTVCNDDNDTTKAMQWLCGDDASMATVRTVTVPAARQPQLRQL
jgi:hypothetical protein